MSKESRKKNKNREDWVPVSDSIGFPDMEELR